MFFQFLYVVNPVSFVENTFCFHHWIALTSLLKLSDYISALLSLGCPLRSTDLSVDSYVSCTLFTTEALEKVFKLV